MRYSKESCLALIHSTPSAFWKLLTRLEYHISIFMQEIKACSSGKALLILAGNLSWKYGISIRAHDDLPLSPAADGQSVTETLREAVGEPLHRWDQHLGLLQGKGILWWALWSVTQSLFLFLQLLQLDIQIEEVTWSAQRGRSDKCQTYLLQSRTPLLLVSLTLLCLTVVASALFCLCCRYWAFCLQTCKEQTWMLVQPPTVEFKIFSTVFILKRK